MRVSHPTERRLRPETHHVWETLERIRIAVGMDHARLAETLRLTGKQYGDLREQRSSLPATSMIWLSDFLGVSFENVMTGDVDFRLLAARFAGDTAALPDRYSQVAFSRKRTSINILAYLEYFQGWRSAQRVLRHFQLSEAVFADPDDLISIQFLADVAAHLQETGTTQSDFFAMGAYSLVTNFGSEMGERLGQLGMPGSLHERVFTDLVSRYYDRNFSYRLLKCTDTEAEVEVVANAQVLEGLQVKRLGNSSVCTVRAGTFASLTGFVKLPFSKVKETACTHRGDSACRFHIDFGGASYAAFRTGAASTDRPRAISG